jgi:hypothetical protein
MNIREIVPLSGYMLRIVFENGRTGVFDVTPYLNDAAFLSLRQPENFRQIRNGGYYIEWESGADLSVDTIDYHLHPASSE